MTSTAEDQQARYDVFLSLGGSDREAGRRLAVCLRAGGARVFVDEDDIEYFAGITRQVHDALSAAKVLVVYYSRSYPLRPSCQLELTAAFLAGQSQGDPAGRIIVVNPEETTAHLQPAELADARFIEASLGPDRVACEILERVRHVVGVVGRAGLRRSGAHHGRIPGATGFVGQYRRHWELHSTLHADDFAMTQEPAHGPVVAVGGLPGVGKTAFVSAYAWRFGAAFPGGVFWTKLGEPSCTAQRRYGDQLAEVARLLGLPVAGHPSRLKGMLAARLGERGRVLWIVDDIPAGSSPDLVHDLVLPAGPDVRTVLVSGNDVFVGEVPLIRLDGLPDDDAAVLLESALSAASPEERAARDRLIRRLGGHGGILTEVARLLRDGAGRISYEMCETMILRREPLLLGKWRITPDLSRVERLVLNMSITTDCAPVDVASTARAVLSAGLSGTYLDALTSVIGSLRALEARYLAVRVADGWRLHPLATALTDPEMAPRQPVER